MNFSEGVCTQREGEEEEEYTCSDIVLTKNQPITEHPYDFSAFSLNECVL